MHPNTFRASVAAALALIASAAAPPARAQTFKPVDARIVNTPAQPVPVSVVASPLAPTLQCRFDLPSAVAEPVVGINRAIVHEFGCPAGVSRLDVRRVLLASPVPHHRVYLGLGSRAPDGTLANEAAFAALSDGTPDLTLPRPVRVDFAEPSNMRFIVDQFCSTGIATVALNCRGTVYLIGTAAN